jgi:hypothetical protein
MLSTNRIEQGLQIVAGVATDPEMTRQELWRNIHIIMDSKDTKVSISMI